MKAGTLKLPFPGLPLMISVLIPSEIVACAIASLIWSSAVLLRFDEVVAPEVG